MKLMVRVSVFALCLAGAVASSFIPKTSASTASAVSAAAATSMVASSAWPLPNCNLGTTCGLGK